MTATAEEFLDDTDPGDDIPTISSATYEGLMEAVYTKAKEEARKELLVEQQYGGGGGGGGEPPTIKTILGDTPKGWGAWLLRIAVAGALAFAAWYTFVNDGLKNRPTHSESEASIKAATEAHEDHGQHDKITDLVEANQKSIEAITGIQIRQTAILESQAKSLDDVRADVKRLRRR